MKIYEFLISQLQQEATLTEKFLERIPQDKMGWKPHEKSMTVKELANHLAEIPTWITATMNQDSMDLTGYQSPNKDSLKDIIGDMKNNTSEAEKALQQPDKVYRKTWKMIVNGEAVMEMPKFNVLQSVVINQFPHHRAQLGVYFRLMDISVPATYGPSADES